MLMEFCSSEFPKCFVLGFQREIQKSTMHWQCLFELLLFFFLFYIRHVCLQHTLQMSQILQNDFRWKKFTPKSAHICSKFQLRQIVVFSMVYFYYHCKWLNILKYTMTFKCPKIHCKYITKTSLLLLIPFYFWDLLLKMYAQS